MRFARTRRTRSADSEKDADQARRALLMADATLDATVNRVTENEKLRDRGFLELRKELLNVLLPHYEELAALRTNDPKLEAAQARAHGKLGIIRLWLGEHEQATRSLSEDGIDLRLPGGTLPGRAVLPVFRSGKSQ